MDRAGCQLAWDHFFQPFQTINREHSRPEFINYLGWRDLWWHKRRDAYKKYVDVIEALHLYLDTMPFSFYSWTKFCDDPEDAVLKGMPIVAYQKQQLLKAAANCVESMVNWTRNRATVAEQAPRSSWQVIWPKLFISVLALTPTRWLQYGVPERTAM
jgi:hypothetical protein